MKNDRRKMGNEKAQPRVTDRFDFEKILSSLGDNISIIDRDLTILWANETVCKHFGQDVAGEKCFVVYRNSAKPCPKSSCPVQRTLKTGAHHSNEKLGKGRSGNEAFYSISADVVATDEAGKPLAVIEVAREITSLKRTEEELEKLNATLERRVRNRTEALAEVVENLRKVILEHNTTLERLKSHKIELERKSKELEDANTTLRVLLANREEEKSAYETKITANIIKYVLPYLDGLKKSCLTDKQKSFVSLVEANLDTVFSPGGAASLVNYAKLTPTELQVANFIKQGRSTKEIAKILNISPRTVETHRDHVRKKFGIKSKGVSLRKTLLSTT